jgi:hypothetical protein
MEPRPPTPPPSPLPLLTRKTEVLQHIHIHIYIYMYNTHLPSVLSAFLPSSSFPTTFFIHKHAKRTHTHTHTLYLPCLLPHLSYLPCLLQTTRARAPIFRIMGRKTTLSTVSSRTVQPPPPSYFVTATTLQTCIQRLVNRYGDI